MIAIARKNGPKAEAADVAIHELISWAKIPDPPETDYILVADEAHYAQSLDAIRTQAFLKLAEQAHARWPLTSTPMKMQSQSIYFLYLWRSAIPWQPTADSMRSAIVQAIHRPVGRKNYVYDTSGASRLDELHQQIKDLVLYKKKEECLDLPPKTRTSRMAEATGQALKAFQKTLDQLRKEHEHRMKARAEERVQELLTLLGEEKSEQINREALVMELAQDENNAATLVEMAILRHRNERGSVLRH